MTVNQVDGDQRQEGEDADRGEDTPGDFLIYRHDLQDPDWLKMPCKSYRISIFSAPRANHSDREVSRG